MSAPNSISVDKLVRLAGTSAVSILDLRSDQDFTADPRAIPGSVRRCADHISGWAPAFAGRRVVTVCATGGGTSQGAAAWLRQAGAVAETLEGGVAAWAQAGHPMVPEAALPPRDAQGRTVWVTRARPKVDRIACPWLIRRFVDPDAVFLFVPPAEVPAVAERFGGAPFDVEGEGVVWGHDGERCTFDAMVHGFGLSGLPALAQLALIVRGADTAQLDVAPQAAGLLAVSLGLSRMFSDDLEQLDAGMLVYDALYRWCRDATGETHDWASHQPKGSRA